MDDEPGIRNTLPVAATVDEASEQVRNEDFDLPLCDLNMHEESDGYIVIRAMQERNPQCLSRRVALSRTRSLRAASPTWDSELRCTVRSRILERREL